MGQVISFFDRQPYKAPPTSRETGRGVDEHAIKLLKSLLKGAKRGDIRGLVVIAGCISDDGHLEGSRAEFTPNVIDHLPLFLGQMELCKGDLKEDHDFIAGVEEYYED